MSGVGEGDTGDSEEIVKYSPAVQSAIDALLQPDDPLYCSDFNVTSYINMLFPTEQALNHLDETMAKVSAQMGHLNKEMAELIESQSTSGAEAQAALEEAQDTIQDLFGRIREIKGKTEMSDNMVKEITRDIKQLDVAKKNLTTSITSLHHLHILLDGVESLGGWIQDKKYDEISVRLPAILNVLQLFEAYVSVPQIKSLVDQVHTLKEEIAERSFGDFKQCFSIAAGRVSANHAQNICKTIHVLGGPAESIAIQWYLEQQLKEYQVLYAETEDDAWLDKIDLRYRWFVNKVMELESSGALALFPPEWEMGRRMALEFCIITRKMLENIMVKKRSEMDSKLLVRSIQYTNKFEQLLNKRYPPRTPPATTPTAGKISHRPLTSTSSHGSTNVVVPPKPEDPLQRNFLGQVREAFEKNMVVFINDQDRNLAEFIDECISKFRRGDDKPRREASTSAFPLPSSSRLFMFFKRIIMEVNEISLDPPKLIAEVTWVFKKYLGEYANRCLLGFLPKTGTGNANTAATGSGALNLNTTATLIQNLLKEASDGSAPPTGRLSQDEQFLTCCILSTADWCAETVHQLQTKLREKVVDREANVKSQVDLSREQDVFYNVTTSALMVLVQDVEMACEAALSAMSKINWSAVDAVGDSSRYVESIKKHLLSNVPLIRDFLVERRKYFGHFCLKFSNQFINKFMQALYRCRPCSVSGLEQLLLDTHTLKTLLLDLPCIQSSGLAKPPVIYTKQVSKGMTKIEMILKIAMSPINPSNFSAYVDHYQSLLPDSDVSEFTKVLELKNLRRSEQFALIDLYRKKVDENRKQKKDTPKEEVPSDQPSKTASESQSNIATDDSDNSKINKLERLVKMKI